MKEKLWRILAIILSVPAIANWLIARAQKTPYFHLDGYMNRWWLFNRYSEVGSGTTIAKQWAFLPSIRIHQILRADTAEHLHDHPWDARTIILKGGYVEVLEDGMSHIRIAGDTRAIRYGEYHHLSTVGHDTYTLFITWDYVGTWGFKVDGKKVPYKEYLAEHPERSA